MIENDLTGTLNLTLEQLVQTKTLYKTKLDSELYQKIRAKFPHLLEMPLE